jgi:UDP-N-acetylglucosamine 2-epimerase (non-hydrolysing)
MRKLLLVAGARPNFMKIAPLVRALRERNGLFRFELIHTGQHYDREMSDVFFEELGIPRPDVHLGVGGGTHAEQTARIMVGFERVCLEAVPDLVLVVGDVNSTMAAAIVAKKLGVDVAHVEAGLRSRDLAMPEEINRMVTDAISDLLFVTEPQGVENLTAEGRPAESIHFVGHVMIDNLFYQLARLESMPMGELAGAAWKSRHPRYGVVTLHRPSNVDDRETLGRLMEALGGVARELPLIFPVHPRTRAGLERFGLELPVGVEGVGPQSYLAFLDLFREAQLVLTDSGGIQEETTALGIPCLTLRENTERPVTVEQGTNVLVGTCPERIQLEADRILSGGGKAGQRPALWDGRAAERIIDVLARWLD